jgi:hypothetical protein
MVAIHLKGYINKQGQLEIDLPARIEPGEVEVTIEVASDFLWTEEELASANQTTPMSGAEIVIWLRETGGWEDQNIPDGAAWVEVQRKKHQLHYPE